MIEFTGSEEVTGAQIGIGIAPFFTVSLGGLLIGVVFGLVTCLITRIRSDFTVFIVLLLAYFSYIMADCVGWSGIISMIGCGLIQAAYAFHNLDEDSVTTVHNFVKVVAVISESVVFVFLGIAVIGETLRWHTGYILWAMAICLIARGIVVLGLTAILNAVNVDQTKISLTEQAVLIYGGLRGAVAFSLAILISNNILGEKGNQTKEIIITATLFIILFTVGFMGITIKPLVKALKIRMEGKKTLSLFTELNTSILDQTLSGIEILIDCKRRNAVREFFMHVDEKYIRRILQRDPERYDEKIFKVYEKISLRLHYATMMPNKKESFLTDLPQSIQEKYLANGIPFDEDHTNEPSHVTSDDILNTYNDNDRQGRQQQKQGHRVKKSWFRRRKALTLDDHIDNTTSSDQRAMEEAKNLPKKLFLPKQSTKNSSEAQSISGMLRYSRRPSLLPNSKLQMGFNDRFLEILKSRNREFICVQ
ncbi:unnamed protein product [Heterobilharzia americana]|nr:unnamed protein product [Heterobilharzia americana]